MSVNETGDENQNLNSLVSVEKNRISDGSTKISMSKLGSNAPHGTKKINNFSPGSVSEDIEKFYKARNEAFKKMMSS